MNHGMYQKSVYKIEFYILGEYSFLCMCCEVIISGAKYSNQHQSHGIETLIFELPLKIAFRKCILLHPSLLCFPNCSLLKLNVLRKI